MQLANKSDKRERYVMKKYQLGLYEKSMPANLTLHEKLVETKQAGFDYMELSIDETEEKLSPEQIIQKLQG